MGASNPGRAWGGHGGQRGYSWAHEARLAGQVARATPEQRQQWQAYVDAMRAEQVAEPDDKVPGLDGEIDRRLKEREQKTRSWRPIEVGKSYRTKNEEQVECTAVEKTVAYVKRRTPNNEYSYVVSLDGAPLAVTNLGDELIGPWAEELVGKRVPPGYQYTGEFRVPELGEYFTPHGVAAGVEQHNFGHVSEVIDDRALLNLLMAKDARRWILIKL